ncbi:MAG: AbrB/MazE/SpoVT family DNA-binding domain-containing protein [Gemmatimonadetes bacterium]|nr:AbrB/MazE/SpoVT family DNA-binding domain-containing protein [Gemmatimonadota bacterium]
MARTRTAGPLTVYAFVGNLGCVRFPPPVRKAAGIKRGDRLTVTVEGENTVVLDKLNVSAQTLRDSLQVEGCACESPPEACGRGDPELVTVGWSYVQLNRDLATEIGFLPSAPLRLVAEPDRITVSVHPDLADLEGVERIACPP